MSERSRRWLTVYCRATGSGQAWARVPVLLLIAFGALRQDALLLVPPFLHLYNKREC